MAIFHLCYKVIVWSTLPCFHLIGMFLKRPFKILCFFFKFVKETISMPQFRKHP